MAEEILETNDNQEIDHSNTVKQSEVEVKDVKLPSDTDNEWTPPSKEDWEKLVTQNQHAENKLKELKDEKSRTVKSENEAKRTAEQESQRNGLMGEIANELLQNEMKFSEDMLTKIEEAGISKTEVELLSYKQRDVQASLYEIAGGKEQLERARAEMENVLSSAEKDAFIRAMQDPVLSKFALKGFMAEYNLMKNNGDNLVQPQGVPTSNASTGYKSMNEYFMDKRAIDRMSGAEKAQAVKKMDAKLAASKNLR